MQHQVSQPLLGARAGARGRTRTAVSSLPNARDERYPRSLAWRAIRVFASVCWLPLAALLGYALATTIMLFLHPSPTGAQFNPSGVASALGIEGLVNAVGQQPMLLAAAFPLVALVVGVVLAVQWSGADRAREAQTLLLREVSPSEQANTSWMRNACYPALEWRVRSLHRRRLYAGLALLAAALLLGTLIALLVAGGSIPIASLVR